MRATTSILAIIIVGALSWLGFGLPGMGTTSASAADERADESTTRSKAEESQARREKEFQESLTDVTLIGRWRLVKDGKLGEEKEEKYTITKVTKVGKIWFISARIQYGDKDVTVPVPVNVEWADDTPIVSVTDAGIPGIGTYSARVLFYRGLYTGAWFGKGYGGLMSGTIVKNKRDEPSKKPVDSTR